MASQCSETKIRQSETFNSDSRIGVCDKFYHLLLALLWVRTKVTRCCESIVFGSLQNVWDDEFCKSRGFEEKDEEGIRDCGLLDER